MSYRESHKSSNRRQWWRKNRGPGIPEDKTTFESYLFYKQGNRAKFESTVSLTYVHTSQRIPSNLDSSTDNRKRKAKKHKDGDIMIKPSVNEVKRKRLQGYIEAKEKQPWKSLIIIYLIIYSTVCSSPFVRSSLERQQTAKNKICPQALYGLPPF